MVMRPATGDLNERAGLSHLSGGFNTKTHPVSLRSEAKEMRLYTDNQAESMSLDQQNFLTQLLNRLPGFAFRCRFEQNRTMEYLSEGCYYLTGYHAIELISNRKKTFGELIYPEDRESVWPKLVEALHSGDLYDLTYRVITASGKVNWIREIGHGYLDLNGNINILEGLFIDINDQRASEEAIRRHIERFEALRKVDIAITGSFDLRVTADILLDQIITHLRVDAACILLYSPESQTLSHLTDKGFRTSIHSEINLKIEDSYAEDVVLEHHAICIPRLTDYPNAKKLLTQYSEEGFIYYYAVPLVAKGQVKGVLEIFYRREFKPEEEWTGFLEALAGQAAIAIDNTTLYSELQRSHLDLTMAYDATLEGLSKILEVREKGTEGHTQRVSELALLLAQKLDIDSSEMLYIRRGAILHDIGKLSIADQILQKPGPLKEEEWVIMRQHPVEAYKFLSTIPNLRSALDIPYCHHERWDGTGYPRGLIGEQIPLAARIFSVLDAWDSMLSARVYRQALPVEQVVTYLKEQSGKQFDPRVVKNFMELIHKD
jgi:putative nucleotidyltransferase with HDIG domain